MKKQRFPYWLTGLLIAVIAGSLQAQVDPKATKETMQLYRHLQQLPAKGFMMGHQDDLAYGVGWKYQPGRSDIHDVTGDYPGIYGWELGRLEIDAPVNLDSVPFHTMKDFIRQGYERGSVITISWHLNNPLTGQSAWAPAPGTVAAILPGGTKHDLYKNWLDKIATFMKSLKGKNGEAIPVVFRPFHELSGSWFWWGKNHCTPEELKQLWQLTVRYLRDEKQVHNLLYAFNTDRFATKEDYLERYPGNEWVDVVGFDIYQAHSVSSNESFATELDKGLTLLEAIAKEHHKIPALTEFGYNGLADSTWWTAVLLPVLQKHAIAWALAWRNAGSKSDGSSEFYVPYKGQLSAADFIAFYRNKRTLFGRDMKKENIYK